MTRDILVTGGAGYVGSHAVRALLARGWRPTVLDDLSTGRVAAIPAGVRLVRGDVGERGLLDAVLRGTRPHAVLHFAGATSAAASVSDPLRYYQSNTANTFVLIQAILASSAPPALLFSSSAAVYGEPMSRRIDEGAPTQPLNPYGASKLMTERMLADAAAAKGLRYVALRYFNVAGVGEGAPDRAPAGAPGSLLRTALDAATGRRGHVPVYGLDHPTPDGTAVRDYIHVQDLAEAHLAALPLAVAGEGPRVLNCGYGRGWSVLEMLSAVERLAGVRLRRLPRPRRAGDPSEVVADNRLILDRTGWRPRRDGLDDIVRDALERALKTRPRGAGQAAPMRETTVGPGLAGSQDQGRLDAAPV